MYSVSVLLPYEFLLEQNNVDGVVKHTKVLLPYEFLLEQNHRINANGLAIVLLPYEFLLEQNIEAVESSAFYGFVTI